MKVRTLKDLATAINAMGTGYTATVQSSWTSTDRDIPGTRLRHPGKGRKGTKLTVTSPTGEVVIRCDTSETTPVYMAVVEAKRLFGAKLDLDPGEVYQPGTQVRVVSSYNLAANITEIVGKPDKVTGYNITLRNGHTSQVEPWEILPS